MLPLRDRANASTTKALRGTWVFASEAWHKDLRFLQPVLCQAGDARNCATQGFPYGQAKPTFQVFPCVKGRSHDDYIHL